ncbi:MAG TPA: HAMP domain-containing sensor histidine kinase [Polyangia bacterium]
MQFLLNRRRHRLRHYFGAHLHRRLFWWFGATIFMTALVVGMLSRRMANGNGSHHVLLTVLIVGVVLWSMSGKIARRIAQPLYELVHVAKEIGAGRLKTRARVPLWRIGEIAVLAQAINDMAERIERQIADQRELLAGVSHEIRTPLARIRVLLELARGGAGGGPGATDARTLDELEREVMEIDALVGELLASARLDFAALAVRPLDGADVARKALERAGVAADVLSVEAPDVAFAGDPTLMARALANLIDNARKYGGGVVRLRVRAEAGLVLFDVEDRGPGFPAAGAEAERPVGSLGLGLVLVRRIADAHKGKLEVANKPEGGARVTIAVSVGAPAAAPR